MGLKNKLSIKRGTELKSGANLAEALNQNKISGRHVHEKRKEKKSLAKRETFVLHFVATNKVYFETKQN